MLDAGVRAPWPPSRRSEPANHQLHLGRAFGIYPFSQGLPGSMNMAFTQANAYSSSGSGNYAYLVPFSECESEVFLKTIIPSRKATRTYLSKRDEDE